MRAQLHMRGKHVPLLGNIVHLLQRPAAFLLAFVFIFSPLFETLSAHAQVAEIQASEPQIQEITTPELPASFDSIIPVPIVEPVVQTGDLVPEVAQDSTDSSDQQVEVPDAESQKLSAPLDEKALQPLALQQGDAGLQNQQDRGIRMLSNSLTPDPSTGALTYSYEIVIPPGRGSMTPTLNLRYSTADLESTSIVGYGWKFDIPSISRVQKNGSENLYVLDEFTSSLSGELATTTGYYYAPKVENGDFIAYAYSDGYWTAWDKDGNIYLFGKSALARQDDPTNSKRVYQWMLEEVRDLHNNYIKFEYSKDHGQIYPSRIVYTGSGTKDGIFEILFTKEKTDWPVGARSFETGFEVQTDYRITKVEVRENKTVVRSYALGIDGADASKRLLLKSITEKGYDPTTKKSVTKKPVLFTYNKSVSPAFEEDTSWSIPFHFYSQPGSDYRFLLIRDLNGDSYPDFVHSEENDEKAIYFSNTDGTWSKDFEQGALFPDYIQSRSYTLRDNSLRLFDVNGDLLTDVIQSHSEAGEESSPSTSKFYQGTLSKETPWIAGTTTAPIGFTIKGSHAQNSASFADINNDGIVDILYGHLDDDGEAGGPLFESVYLGTGAGWIKAPESMWHLPWAFVDENSAGSEVSTFAGLLDLNDDSLTDFAFRYEDSDIGQKIGINTGTTFITNPSHNWQLRERWTQGFAYAKQSRSDAGIRFLDVNGDRLTDMVSSRASMDGKVDSDVFFNTLSEAYGGFSQAFPGNLPVSFADHADNSTHIVIADINADGADDLLYSEVDIDGNNASHVYLNKNKPVTDFLSSVQTPEGSTASIEYKMSSEYRDSSGALLNPNLPLIVPTVSSITVTDGTGDTTANQKSTYTYAKGSFYFKNARDRKFAGFGEVSKTDAEGFSTKTYYHQGNDTNSAKGELTDHISMQGKAYRIEEYSNTHNRLLKSTTNTWRRNNQAPNRDYISLSSQVASTYNQEGSGDLSTHVDTAVEYTYDSQTGNVLTETQRGEVSALPDGSYTDTGTDAITKTLTYAKNWTTRLLSPVTSERVTDQQGTLWRESKYYYDGQPFGTALKGDRTKTERLISGSTYQTTSATYHANGLPLTTTDPRGKVTTQTYDSALLHPITITRPLGLVEKVTYDYSSGKPITITDVNGFVSRFWYDGFDRITEERYPDPVSGSAVTRNLYTYDDVSLLGSVTKSEYVTSGSSRVTTTYLDGLSRPLQVRKEMEGSNYSVADHFYNGRGQLSKVLTPYSGSGSAKTARKSFTTSGTGYSYDAFGRVVMTHTPTGTITNIYDGRTTRRVDQEGKSQWFKKDAFDRLVEVTEYLNNGYWKTSYAWTPLGELSRITDAKNNTRSFTYDLIGNRTSAEDLHAPTDTTFGTWQYAYDVSGNLTKRTDPRGYIVQNTYDDNGRLLTKDYTGLAGIEETYTYDTCLYGKGKLCTVASNSGVLTGYTYDKAGGVATDTRTISGTPYTTTYTRDRTGAPLTIKHPDGSIISYVYNTAALLEAVKYQEVGGTLQNIVSTIDYTPVDSIALMKYGNSVTTTRTYDPLRSYVLTGIKTLTSTSTKLLELAYTYDKVGNITKIVDTSKSNSAKTVSYSYDDLYRLTNATATSTVPSQNFTETFSYDILGNLFSNGSTTYSYAGNTGSLFANPHAPTTIGGLQTTYDKNGNVLTYSGITNTWDYQNQLITSSISSGTTTTKASYLYDHQGERASRTIGGVVSVYPTDGYALIAGKKTKQVFGAGLLLATIEQGTGTTTATQYVHTDHLGSTRVVSDKSGNRVQLLDYTAYGKSKLNERTGAFSEERTYLGEILDPSSAYTYLNARYYDSGRGQFLSQDPVFFEVGLSENGRKILLDPQLHNSYGYARGNPVTYSDASGRIPPLAIAALAWGAVELGLTGYDVYTTGQTMLDPQATVFDKSSAVVLTVAGAVGPGGGYKGVGNTLIGMDFGKLGTVVENVPGEITGIRGHALDRMKEKNVSVELMNKIVSSAEITLKQTGDVTLYLTKEGAVVLNNIGEVVTTYSKDYFKPHIKDILKQI